MLEELELISFSSRKVYRVILKESKDSGDRLPDQSYLRGPIQRNFSLSRITSPR